MARLRLIYIFSMILAIGILRLIYVGSSLPIGSFPLRVGQMIIWLFILVGILLTINRKLFGKRIAEILLIVQVLVGLLNLLTAQGQTFVGITVRLLIVIFYSYVLYYLNSREVKDYLRATNNTK